MSAKKVLLWIWIIALVIGAGVLIFADAGTTMATVSKWMLAWWGVVTIISLFLKDSKSELKARPVKW